MKRFSIIVAFGLFGLSHSAFAQDDGVKLWDKIYQVFSHPRCANCHVGPDNIPRWSGPSYGKGVRFHGMNIKGGTSRVGAEAVNCKTCHTKHNSDVPHGPPGAHVWALAPVEMQWLDKSPAEVCAQIKDPAQNGGRTIQEVAAHIDHDALVHWGWEPGPGREPAPYSKGELVEMIKKWNDAGAPCPGS